MRVCPFCNSNVRIYDNYCTKCGKHLTKTDNNYKQKNFNLLNLNNVKKENNKVKKNFYLLNLPNNKENTINKVKTNYSKIDFNTVSRFELKKIKEFSDSEIEKIINLRDHGIKFTYYTDIAYLKKDLKNMKPIIKKIDINNITKKELFKIKELNILLVNKIDSLRKNGQFFYSYEDFQEKLHLTDKEMKNFLKYNDLEFNKNKNYLSNEKNSNKEKIININTADFDVLKTIPYLNIYKINTILDLRNKNIYITSFEDLKIKLNLSCSEIEELKKIISIKTPESEKIEKIDINKVNMLELAEIGIPSEKIAKIILNRNKGVFISSFDELKNKYSLNNYQITKIKEICKITPIKNLAYDDNKEDLENKDIKILHDFPKNDKELIKENEEKIIDKNEVIIQKNEYLNKIDINNAQLEELTNIHSINLIKAKKIIELRNEGNMIKSYDDLKEKLNLSSNQIQQIKDETIISFTKIKKNRVVDL